MAGKPAGLLTLKGRSAWQGGSKRSLLDLRVKILSGGWPSETNEISDWDAPTKQLLVFVSSTFTDTHIERNILIEQVLPGLRLKGKRSYSMLFF